MRILYVTTISLTMNSFFKPHIEMLVREGHQVDIACNCKDLALDGLYGALGCESFQIDFSRSPLSPDNIRAYSQLEKVIKSGNYDIVHCHTPNASVVTRLVCRRYRKKNGLKVFYTAHGFHFYKGAPLLNWLIYYPVERICSRITDKLITINQEDYRLAVRRFKAKEVHYVPGVGIDLSRFENVQVDKRAKRREIGVPEDAFLLLSVGELNENKNHQVIIRALAKLNNPKVHYAIAGVGDKREYLQQLAEKLGVAKQVHLLGYRKDVFALYHSAEVFVFPSYREGLSVSLMEAMASRLPVVCSCIRGNTDLTNTSGGVVVLSFDAEDWTQSLRIVINNNLQRMGEHNRKQIEKFSVANVLLLVKAIYER